MHGVVVGVKKEEEIKYIVLPRRVFFSFIVLFSDPDRTVKTTEYFYHPVVDAATAGLVVADNCRLLRQTDFMRPRVLLNRQAR